MSNLKINPRSGDYAETILRQVWKELDDLFVNLAYKHNLNAGRNRRPVKSLEGVERILGGIQKRIDDIRDILKL